MLLLSVGFFLGLIIGLNMHDIERRGINTTTLLIPAINQNGDGVLAEIKVSAFPGNGKVLTEIDNVIFQTDTQSSIKTARDVAKHFIKNDINKYDLIYIINTDADLIEGPSAGAAIAILTVAVIDGIELKKDVFITGSVDESGKILKSSHIRKKSKALKSIGNVTFLIPENSTCDINICTEDDLKEIEKGGIKIMIVKDVKEALSFMKKIV